MVISCQAFQIEAQSIDFLKENRFGLHPLLNQAQQEIYVNRQEEKSNDLLNSLPIINLWSKVNSYQQQLSSFFLFVPIFCKENPQTAVQNFFFLLRILVTSQSKAPFVVQNALALVSTQTMPIQSETFFAAYLLTSLLPYKSILFPTRSKSILETSVFSLTYLIQKLIISKDFLFEMSNTKRIPSTLRQQLGVIVLQRVVPAVSHICTLMVLPSSSLIVFCLYSTPIVVVWLRLNSSSTYWVSKELLPTQLYPIMSNLTLVSYLVPLIMLISIQYQIRHFIRIL